MVLVAAAAWGTLQHHNVQTHLACSSASITNYHLYINNLNRATYNKHIAHRVKRHTTANMSSFGSNSTRQRLSLFQPWKNEPSPDPPLRSDKLPFEEQEREREPEKVLLGGAHT